LGRDAASIAGREMDFLFPRTSVHTRDRIAAVEEGEDTDAFTGFWRAFASGRDSAGSGRISMCAAGGKRCVLRKEENGQFIFYELDPIRGALRELTRVGARRAIFADWGLSPDGRFAALPDHDASPSRFRIVDLDRPEDREREILVDGIPTLISVTWATGRPGWYVAAGDLSAGMKIRYVNEQGRSWRLWETAGPTWSVPSGDGRHLAFVDGEPTAMCGC
jgi:hypothetical protein